jgi:hypothetical protein
VSSDNEDCQEGRVISLKKKKRGRDGNAGATVSNQRGRWSIGKRNPKGRFYAIAKRRSFEDEDGNTIICRRAKSKTIRP